ncbi:putative T7SS-secreted protein, partial [Mycobacteroides chelonae]
MGKHWWDEFVDKGEELWDDAKKTVGEIVDKATDVAGDALEAVGLDSWAKAVEDFGDQVASELGATPGEKNLGESDDPKDLVHGDAGALRGAGEKVTSFGNHFEQAGNGLRGVSTGEFEGKSAEAYHATINAEIPKWFKAADAMKKASTGFSDMAQAVEFGQKKAAEAIRLYKEAKTKHDEWQKKADAYNDAVDRRNGGEDVTLPEKPGDDPGPALLQQAKDTLKEGRKHRNEIAEKVAKTWNDAAAEAPELPPGFQRLVNDISDLGQAAQSFKTHFTVGLLGGLTDMVKTVRTVNPVDPYNLAHPADYVNNATAVAAGLSDVVANPEKLVTGLIGDGWSTDPGQALGTLTSNFIPLGPPGAGVAAGLAKVGLKTAITDAVKGGVKDAVRTGAKDTAATSARDAGSSAVRDSRSGAHVTETPASHTNTPATHTADTPAPQQHGTPT